jgi:hypothetical protein
MFKVLSRHSKMEDLRRKSSSVMINSNSTGFRNGYLSNASLNSVYNKCTAL